MRSLSSLCFLLFLILLSSACRNYQATVAPPSSALVSPPYPSIGEVFNLGESPEQAIVVGEREHFHSEAAPWSDLKRMAGRRNYDGVLIMDHHIISTEETKDAGPNVLDLILLATDTSYVYEPNYRTFSYESHELEYMPFIYLNRMEDRDYLDWVEVEVVDTSGESRKFPIHFNWQGQIDSIPFLKQEDQLALLVQPWFFLEQMGSAWLEDQSQNWLNMPYRRYKGPSALIQYSPMDYGWQYRFWIGKSRWDLRLAQNAKGRWQVQAIKYAKDWVTVVQSDFLDRTLMQEWQGPNGTLYRYRYHYKRTSQIPPDWIIRPKDLQQ
ncbi:hypothetical protein [Croceimicrobium sp.]|uniref:hypothetical protein n=1 Tax=Croceimicrobium sp. TaxID=2828340 RepID=UPI003BADB781